MLKCELIAKDILGFDPADETKRVDEFSKLWQQQPKAGEGGNQSHNATGSSSNTNNGNKNASFGHPPLKLINIQCEEKLANRNTIEAIGRACLAIVSFFSTDAPLPCCPHKGGGGGGTTPQPPPLSPSSANIASSVTTPPRWQYQCCRHSRRAILFG